ncbi:MAG: Na+ dependent nucleoside transporter domain protein [Planctomycetia bacterium]|nr:Na+ dependent nucleoside transporter domain protein [Planctomycetia bacterium]
MEPSAEPAKEVVGVAPQFAPTPRWWRFGIVAGVVVLGVAAYALRGTIGPRGQGACGVACFIGIVAACSANLRAVRYRTIACGFALQVALALVVLKWDLGYRAFAAVGGAIKQFLDFTGVGAKFVFGKLADPDAMAGAFGPDGAFVFAFTALPAIIFISSFFTVLYYFGILQFFVRLMARAMMYLMDTSGAETLSAVANVFMGQTEAPLIVKPYVVRMTRSELLALMVGGMATISGGMMAVYIRMGADEVAILATSVMAAPCGLYLAKLMLPETELPETHGRAKIRSEKLHANAIDAAAAGASDGLHMALNVGAMIIAFLAFIALIDALLAGIKPGLISCGLAADSLTWWPDRFSLAYLFSHLFAPAAFLMGAEPKDVPLLADLLGTKLVSNEMIAFMKLTAGGADGYRDVISPRGYVLATYALTGFANLASLGILLGGVGAMAPSRRGDLAALGGRALLCGFLATLINAAVAGVLMD